MFVTAALTSALVFATSVQSALEYPNPPYIGCFHYENGRPLPTYGENFGRGTPAYPGRCEHYCKPHYDGNNYTLFAIEANYICYCGFTSAMGLTQLPDTECYTPCDDDPSSSCGGGRDVVAIYGDASAVPPAGYLYGLNYDSCYIDSDLSVLDGPSYTDTDDMTVNSCASFCISKHNMKNVYLLDGGVCNHPLTDSSSTGGDTCGNTCPGDVKQFCGGPPQYGYKFTSHWKFD